MKKVLSGEVKKIEPDVYSSTCAFCGSTKNIHLWPHRMDGKMVGLLFMCEKCSDPVPDVSIQITNNAPPKRTPFVNESPRLRHG